MPSWHLLNKTQSDSLHELKMEKATSTINAGDAILEAADEKEDGQISLV